MRGVISALSLLFLCACGDDAASSAAGSGGAGGMGAGMGTSGGGAGGSGGTSGGAGGGSGGAGGTVAESGSGGTSAGTGVVGDGPMIAGCPVFPAESAWNVDVSEYPLHADSDTYVDSIGRDDHVHPDFGTVWDGAPIGIPFVVVDGAQADVDIVFTAYGDESDPGPYPVPADAPVEGGPASDGDRHVIVVDSGSCTLYELYRAFPQGDGSWEADSGAVFDLRTDDMHPLTWTSADAAGLPIFPGLARYEEIVEEGELRHALRFTVSESRRAIVAPARHFASSNDDAALPPMGLRFRMKASYDCSGYSAEAQVVCDGLKRYGMIVADNGSDWYVSGAPDERWDDDALGDLKQIPGDAFEVVDTGPIETY